MSFGGHTKTRHSLLSGVDYARGSERLQNSEIDSLLALEIRKGCLKYTTQDLSST